MLVASNNPLAHSMKYSFIRNKHGDIAIWQSPNFALWAWIVLTIASKLITDDQLQSGLQLTARAFLFAWAYLEIRSGESPFRRALGGVILASILVSFFKN